MDTWRDKCLGLLLSGRAKMEEGKCCQMEAKCKHRGQTEYDCIHNFSNVLEPKGILFGSSDNFRYVQITLRNRSFCVGRYEQVCLSQNYLCYMNLFCIAMFSWTIQSKKKVAK